MELPVDFVSGNAENEPMSLAHSPIQLRRILRYACVMLAVVASTLADDELRFPADTDVQLFEP